MSDLLTEIRYALRTLRRAPGSNLVIVLTLALGLGINATFFSSFHAMVTRPLPFDDPQTLLSVSTQKLDTGQSFFLVSEANYLDLRRSVGAFEQVEAFSYSDHNLHSSELPERVSGAAVTPGLFPMLGAAPSQGRGFTEADAAAGAPPVAILSARIWRTSFGADPSVLGRTVRIDEVPHEIVGIMPDGFQFPHTEDLWTPRGVDPVTAQRAAGSLDVIARLAQGTDLAAARAEAASLATQLEQTYPDTNEDRAFDIRPLHERWMPPVTQTAAWVMQGLVSLVLLIVCANVASMVLARATVRRRELALRSALGASRWRLLRQSLVETLFLGGAGAGLGLLLTVWQGDWIQRISPISIPYWLDFRIDGVVVAYTAACTLLVAVLLGILPTLRDRSATLERDLREGGRGTEGGRGGRLRRGLVISEYAMAVIILVGALLMVRSYQQLRDRDPGFSIEDVTSARVAFSDAYAPERAVAYLDLAVERLAAQPGIEAAAVMNRLPISRAGLLRATLEVEGLAFEQGEHPESSLQAVSPGLFATLDIEPRRGRSFRVDEVETGAQVAVIDEDLAQRLWPGDDPVGRRIRQVRDDAPWLTVIGTVETLDPGEMLADIGNEPGHQVYVPLTLGMGALAAPDEGSSTSASTEDVETQIAAWGPLTRRPFLVVRSDLEPTAVGDILRRELAAIDPSIPLFEVASMSRSIEQYYFAQHIWGVMFSIIAVVALLIAAVGAYGVSAYSVQRRVREMGIRLALGARPARLLRSVVGQGVGLAGIGLVLGLLGALPVAFSLARLLHGVEPTDSSVFGSVGLLLVTLAALSSLAPARRAARVDPAVTLRDE